ncbi:MAG: hypothetical protein K2L99_02445 [Muribaculaceae bacterium]|nr:hypothetical protein [Muribaculaceae bacterium]MDE6285835.1 hypothetical protein [Muribaculaceae bacterium]
MKMKTTTAAGLALLFLLWLGLVALIIKGTERFTLYTAFVIVASGIIIFVPLYRKYFKED